MIFLHYSFLLRETTSNIILHIFKKKLSFLLYSEYFNVKKTTYNDENGRLKIIRFSFFLILEN